MKNQIQERIVIDKEVPQIIEQRIESTINQLRQEKKKQFSYKKDRRTVLIGIAVILVASSAIIANVGSLTVKQIFSDIFKSNASNIDNNGIVLIENDECSGVILSGEGVLLDTNTMDLIFNIKKEDGSIFNEDKIRFEDLNVDIDDQLDEINDERGIVGWTNYIEIDSGNDILNQRRFLLNMASASDIQNQKIRLQISNIIQYQEQELFSDINIGNYLETVPECIDQLTIPSTDIRLTGQFLSTNSEEDRQIKASIPKNVLDFKSLDIPLFSQEVDIKIDNMGFVDESFHIRLKRSYHVLRFKDEKGNDLEPSYMQRDAKGGYYVYDIKNLEELKQLQAYICIEKETNRIEGIWQIEFRTDVETNKVIITPSANLNTNNRLDIVQIEVSNLSLTLISKVNSEKRLSSPKIEINFNSGEESKIFTSAGIAPYNDSTQKYIYKFSETIDVSSIENIMIDENKISIDD